MPETPEPPRRSPDPVDDTDPEALRAEILRLRDEAEGASSRNEVLDDRIGELEAQVEELATHNEALQAELARNPVMRVARAALRQVRRRR